MGETFDGEVVRRFPCFGGSCAVMVRGRGPAGASVEAAERTSRRMRQWHSQFSRFEHTSELCTLNDDPRETVPVSPIMGLFLETALSAASSTGGLIDPTLADEIGAAGYERDLDAPSLALGDALRIAPPRRPACASPRAGWRKVRVDRREGVVMRPRGVRFDSGGVAKGFFGDVLASSLGGHRSFAVDAAGDVRCGGTDGARRPLRVTSPFDDSILHTFSIASGAAATSGISKRSWLDPRGLPAHHLLDPASGRPAFTGVVQATALAPSGARAETLAKAALLSGPDHAAEWLPHGGLLVYEDGATEVVEPDERR
jgi:FAD:protein FMN transferase